MATDVIINGKSDVPNWIKEIATNDGFASEKDEFIGNLRNDLVSKRVFVFTPQGDVVDLPIDASPIDFAYAIHSDIGDHISGTKVNGKIAPILSKLKNGDIVEIITKKDSHPSSKWLEFSKTNQAKKNIRSYLEKHSLLSKLKSFGNN